MRKVQKKSKVVKNRRKVAKSEPAARPKSARKHDAGATPSLVGGYATRESDPVETVQPVQQEQPRENYVSPAHISRQKEKKRLTVFLTPDVYKRIRLAALNEDRPMTLIVEELILTHLRETAS